MQMKTLNAIVVSTKNPQTVVVTVAFTKTHPKYKKIIKKTTRFAVHNDIEGIKVGDTVKVAKSRPYSKTKHFKVVKLVKSK